MIKYLILIALAVILLFFYSPKKTVQQTSQTGTITIFMIGNSTMANKPYKDGNPEKGWGQLFPLYFTNQITIENFAVNGRSTKSFIDEGRWTNVMLRMKKGDYVIMEFGHNDAKKEDPKRYAEANTNYKWNLEKFIKETLQKGGIPVLATPIVRRRFDANGKFYDAHGDYPKVVRELAETYKIVLIDLHKKSEEYIIKLGEERSKEFYLHIDNDEYNSLPAGLTDDTHLSPSGAFRICDFAIEEIKNKIPGLVPYIKN